MGKILAFSNQKGGIGKTTSAVNIAASLGTLGKKVLLCDLDPQGNATSGVGVSKKGDLSTVYDTLINGKPLSEVVIETPYKNLWAAPSNISLAGAEVEAVEAEKREFLFQNAVESVRADYDYIIVDCPPSLGLLTLNALAAADGVIIPMTCEYYAMEGLVQLVMTVRRVKRLYNPGLEITGILITQYDKRLNLTKNVLSEIEKYYKDRIFATKIARNVRLTEAPSYGMPVYYYDKSSKGSEQYISAAKELMKRI